MKSGWWNARFAEDGIEALADEAGLAADMHTATVD